MRIITPTSPSGASDAKVLFLAGPIRGVGNWQSRALEILETLGVDATVANPRRELDIDRDFADADYDIQLDWEQTLLDRAAKNGVTLFWLAKEATHDCDHPFAQQTRFEIGEAVALHRSMGAKVVVGFEEGFGGDRYIRRIIAQKAPGIPVFASLQETCAAAAQLLA